MKTIKGFPTMKSLGENCDKHSLRIHPIGDYYRNTKAIVFSHQKQNETAKIVNDEISKLFITQFRPASQSLAITGQIKIISKRDIKP